MIEGRQQVLASIFIYSNLQDVLHPMATLQCEEHDYDIYVHCMTFLEDKVYFYGANNGHCVLSCASLTDLTSLSELSLPPDYDVQLDYSALTTYQSKLILLGGMESEEITNKVWASADGHNWQSLPPMSRCRSELLAFSSASPECLIVVGGDTVASAVTTMEIFSRGEWMSVALPEELHSYSSIEGIVHNRSLHLYYMHEQGIHYCKMESLLASATQVGEDGRKCPLWRSIKCPPHCYYSISYSILKFSLFSFEQHLLAINEESIYVFSPNTQSWVLLGDNPAWRLPLCAVTVSDYILIMTCRGDCNYLHKLKATGMVYKC